jgi:hypothetical protein
MTGTGPAATRAFGTVAALAVRDPGLLPAPRAAVI